MSKLEMSKLFISLLLAESSGRGMTTAGTAHSISSFQQPLGVTKDQESFPTEFNFPSGGKPMVPLKELSTGMAKITSVLHLNLPFSFIYCLLVYCNNYSIISLLLAESSGRGMTTAGTAHSISSFQQPLGGTKD